MSYIESLGDFSIDCGMVQDKGIKYDFTFAGHKLVREVNWLG
jgi:hypothetical protein